MISALWNPAWETGISDIDQQHRELFRQVDDLLLAVHHDEHLEQIPRVLAFLTEYIETHFACEELQMERSAYPGLEVHRAVHDDMRQRASELLAGATEDPEVVTDAVIVFLIDWLVGHIDGEDRLMARHLQRCQVPRSEVRS